ncbi:hypothetical protein B0T17DRAFT_506916 [Bombardia bombarda]|uniref:Uncharacterized protein n=1 Tax=Bombardia bombarda TaxID=252184 RepID=A0AA39XB29_9PEZI|nr:hypothetical protein B0T17DRAFT_506916 [Bombardia bombarda]
MAGHPRYRIWSSLIWPCRKLHARLDGARWQGGTRFHDGKSTIPTRLGAFREILAQKVGQTEQQGSLLSKGSSSQELYRFQWAESGSWARAVSNNESQQRQPALRRVTYDMHFSVATVNRSASGGDCARVYDTSYDTELGPAFAFNGKRHEFWRNLCTEQQRLG